MADGPGWQTVLPTSHSGIERLGRAQLEAYERQVLRDWEVTRGHWSGIGKHTSAQEFTEAKKLHPRLKRAADRILGSGAYGIVEKVHYTHNNRSICLARKHIQYRRGRTVQLLRQEATVMEKLDHEHIVKLVGTYCLGPCELYLLLWPVAVCNLDSLFNDLDALRQGHGDREDTLKRLAALELTELGGLEGKRSGAQSGRAENCPLHFLRRITGCIAHAVAYCHEANIRHLDLKPSNILLNPGGSVYLADFGIARDVHEREHTMTFGLQGTPKWRAPEICDPNDEWSMKAADVYSLGLVLLNVATVLYGADMADFDAVLEDLVPRQRAEKLKHFHAKLETYALATQEVDDHRATTFGPKHLIGLTTRMLSSNPASRPRADEVESELVDLGGIDQIYHGPCCRKGSRFVIERLNARFKMATSERDRLVAEHAALAKQVDVLMAKDETYEARIKKERTTHAEQINKLQEQLAKERKERERLEGLVAEMQPGYGRRPPRIPRPTAAAPRTMVPVKPPASRLPPSPQPPHSLPSPAASPLPSPSTSVLQYQRRPPTGPAAMFPSQTRPTYSQTAAAAAVRTMTTPTATPTPPIFTQSRRALSPTSARRPHAFERLSTDSLGDSHPPGSHSPGSPAGFSMRSRASQSRLPVRTGSSHTLSRADTPNLNRDSSLTDSTQLSMASSTFSRLSRETDSITGTPALGRVASIKTDHEEETASKARVQPEDPSANLPQETGLGLGIALTRRRESSSIDADRLSMRDTASVASAALTNGTVSPSMTGSAFSSPRAGKAELYSAAGGALAGMPSLPTAKSWADVARREMRQRRLEVPLQAQA